MKANKTIQPSLSSFGLHYPVSKINKAKIIINGEINQPVQQKAPFSSSLFLCSHHSQNYGDVNSHFSLISSFYFLGYCLLPLDVQKILVFLNIKRILQVEGSLVVFLFYTPSLTSAASMYKVKAHKTNRLFPFCCNKNSYATWGLLLGGLPPVVTICTSSTIHTISSFLCMPSQNCRVTSLLFVLLKKTEITSFFLCN